MKEYTEAKHEADMNAKLKELGLYNAVKEILDEIVESSGGYGYTHYSLMSEYACDILKLIELAESEGKYGNI